MVIVSVGFSNIYLLWNMSNYAISYLLEKYLEKGYFLRDYPVTLRVRKIFFLKVTAHVLATLYITRNIHNLYRFHPLLAEWCVSVVFPAFIHSLIIFQFSCLLQSRMVYSKNFTVSSERFESSVCLMYMCVKADNFSMSTCVCPYTNFL